MFIGIALAIIMSRLMNVQNSQKNSFGKFLSSLRIARGFENVSEYLRSYPIGISSVHYRHLESGERNISIEAAKQLCAELQAESKEFYFNLLSDWLPSEIMNFLLPLSERTEECESSYRRAVESARQNQVLFPEENCCNYLRDNFELLPIVWMVYSLPKIPLDTVEKFVLEKKISKSAQTISDDFEKFGLVQLTPAGELQRVRPTISFVHHDLGRKIAEHQIEEMQAEDSLMSYSIASLSEQAQQIIFRRIQEFIRDTVNAAEDTYMCGSQSAPVFYSLVLASKSE